ncbi:Dynein heavy chain [Phytophthora cactorum]|nr:Dynein heavy chain [Phytophthora cactorum]
MDGLEDQLLGDVVRHERPDIEEKKNRLVVTMAQDKKQLKEIEDRILKQLSESSGNVLDDQDLIDTLQSSNVTSRIIKERVLESESTEIEINRAREEYRSLIQYLLRRGSQGGFTAKRLTNLIDFQTRYIYVNICRGLFEVHKVLFSMLICCKILLHSGKISAPEMGAEFGRNASTTMEEIYNDTDRKTPCIFVLSAGADPTGMLLRFAKEMSFIDRLHLISLGQGQGPRAEKLIESSQGSGDWVLLQNCHLAKSWMPKLEKLVEDMGQRTDEQCQTTFRLFLTSFPAAYFPVTVLQNGIKLTNEPPKGIRANLVRSFNTLLSEEVLEGFHYLGNFDTGESKDHVWKSLLCALTFFHAIVQERRKFGALGWNIKYEFNDTDLETSLASLRKFLEEQPIIPWDALRYVTGQINYGGRVTDDWDRRCLTSILSNFYTPDVLHSGHSYSTSGIYHVPKELSHSSIQSYLSALPAFDNPELFGMHENANVTYERNESANMMQLILSLEPRDGGGVEANLNVEEAGPTTFKTREVAGTVVMDSLATVLGQEVIKFNTLLRRMRSSLRDIQKAINGLIVMSSDLDNMYMAFLNGKVPQLWSSVSFASLKPLASWVRDLLDRVSFFRQWLLHEFARKYQTAIDSLAFTFTVMDVENAQQLTQSPTDGIYVDGLWLQGAKWSPSRRLLEDAKPGEMFSAMSIVHFLPATSVVASNPTLSPGIMMYPCPVYKTSVRQGTLSTTGISTNYVIAVQLPSDKPPNYWVMMGAAFLLNLDN